MQTPFDPRTPASPQSLSDIGLKPEKQYTNSEGFAEILAKMMTPHIEEEFLDLESLKLELGLYLRSYEISSENSLAAVGRDPDVFKGNSIAGKDGPQVLSKISPVVQSMLRTIACALGYVRGVKHYLSTEVSFEMLSVWTVAMSQVANPATSGDQVNATVSVPSPPGKHGSKDIPNFALDKFNGTALEGDSFLRDVQARFKSRGAHEFLVSEEACNVHLSFSMAYASRIRELL